MREGTVSDTLVAISVDGPCGTIMLDRPDKYNALTSAMLLDLAAALDELEERPEVRGIVITGTDKFFSTGADLNEALTVRDVPQYLRYNRRWRTLTYKIEHLMKPVIAAISGYCVTGGLEIAMACDIRIAAENAQFAMTSAKIGSVAGAGGTQRLPRLVGLAKAKELLFGAEFIDAGEALRIGLINRVVPAGQAVPAARALIDVFVERGPLSLALAKIAANVGIGMDLESALDLEAALSSEAFATEDKAEGMRAFLEKRRAAFKGR